MSERETIPKYESRVDLSFAELLRFQIHILVKRFGWFLLLFTAIGLVLPIAVVMAPRGDTQLHPGVFIPLLIVAVLVGSTYFGTRSQYRRFWQTEAPMTVTIGDDGIRTKTRSTASQHLWSRVQRVDETREFLLFYVDKMAAIILPKRCISGETKVQEILDYAKTRSGRDAVT